MPFLFLKMRKLLFIKCKLVFVFARTFHCLAINLLQFQFFGIFTPHFLLTHDELFGFIVDFIRYFSCGMLFLLLFFNHKNHLFPFQFALNNNKFHVIGDA